MQTATIKDLKAARKKGVSVARLIELKKETELNGGLTNNELKAETQRLRHEKTEAKRAEIEARKTKERAEREAQAQAEMAAEMAIQNKPSFLAELLSAMLIGGLKGLPKCGRSLNRGMNSIGRGMDRSIKNEQKRLEKRAAYTAKHTWSY